MSQFTQETTRPGQGSGRFSPPPRDGAARTPAEQRDERLRDVTQKRSGFRLSNVEITLSRKIKRPLVIDFANQLAVMVDTGVPLGEAMACVHRHCEDPKFRNVLGDVSQRVQAGQPLSEALAAHPQAFPAVMTSLLRASEATGTMGAMLLRVADYLTNEYEAIRKVRGAMMYPACMIAMCMGVTIFLLIYVLPKFADIYANRGATLPAPTRALMAISEFLVGYWPYWTTGVIGLLIALLVWARSPMGRGQVDWLKINVPVFGPLFRKFYLSRACRTLSLMVQAGVPLLDTIAIVRGVTPNKCFNQLWDNSDNALRTGHQLSEVMLHSDLIPGSTGQMVLAGEKSGQLGEVMGRVADFQEREMANAIQQATQFIEPAMIVTMGSIIGFIAIALLIPIFSVGRVMAGG